jgi:hypothetical protein
MTVETIKDKVIKSFEGTYIIEKNKDVFFLYGPDDRFPFLTIVTHDDDYDNVSNLNRPGFFRLNVGIGKDEFMQRFGHIDHEKGIGGYLNSGIDFTEENKVFPHPVYGSMYWVSIVNPTEEALQGLLPYIKIAYENLVKKEKKTATH